jgi:hypothetical protein
MMYCDSQFHDTETRAQVTAGNCDRADRLGSHLCRYLWQIALFELTKIGG